MAPPIGRTVDRDSSTFGVQQYDYGNVETAEEVGWDNYKAVVDGIMEMLSRTGLAHGYSYNTWSDVVSYTDKFIEDWLASPQTSMYYSLQVMQNTQAKDDALAAPMATLVRCSASMKLMMMTMVPTTSSLTPQPVLVAQVTHLFIPMKAETPYIHLHERSVLDPVGCLLVRCLMVVKKSFNVHCTSLP